MNKKYLRRILIVGVYPENGSEADIIKAENSIVEDIAELLQKKYVDTGCLEHFLIGGEDTLCEKLRNLEDV